MIAQRGRPSQRGPTRSPCSVDSIVKKVLEQSVPGVVYRHRLLQALEGWLETDTGVPTIGLLPILTCEVNGGQLNRAVPVTVAWQLVRRAIKLLDDVEDGDVSDQQSLVVNMATGLLCAAHLALDVLSEQNTAGRRILRLRNTLDRAIVRACAGQDKDLDTGNSKLATVDPDTWLEIAGAKSGELLAWCAWSGALVAGTGEAILPFYRDYGYHLGILMQVADDFRDVWVCGQSADLSAKRPTLPVCYAFSVTDGEKRKRLETQLLQAPHDEAARVHVQEELIDLGAQAYMLVVGRMHYDLALMALRRAEVKQGSYRLVDLVRSVMPALEHIGS